MRLKLVPTTTNINFFLFIKFIFGSSILAMIASVVIFCVVDLNYGIDFRGGTSIRTDSQVSVNVAKYREALEPLDLGDISITQVTDLAKPDQNVAQIRIQAQDGDEAISNEIIIAVKAALNGLDISMTFPQVESVGPKVSSELIKTAVIAVLLAIAAVLFYIWLRFEWQFSVGAVAALVHDVVLTI